MDDGEVGASTVAKSLNDSTDPGKSGNYLEFIKSWPDVDELKNVRFHPIQNIGTLI